MSRRRKSRSVSVLLLQTTTTVKAPSCSNVGSSPECMRSMTSICGGGAWNMLLDAGHWMCPLLLLLPSFGVDPCIMGHMSYNCIDYPII